MGPGRVKVDAVMATQRAQSFTRRSLKGGTKLSGLLLAMTMLDLTTLEGKDSPETVRALCRRAVKPYVGLPLPVSIPSVAAVCVYPSLIRTCVDELSRTPVRQTRVKVASVATGFPSGQFPLSVRLDDVRRAVADGADEIDMVINRGAFLAGRYDEVADEIRHVKRACRRDDGSFAHLKVILETGELETLDQVRFASDLSIRAMADVDDEFGVTQSDPRGTADFIKTSTGKVQPAATMPVTLVMLESIRDWYLRTGRVVGMKPAGGIRTAKLALHYLVMVRETMALGVPGFASVGGNPWLTPDYFRFGASALCTDLLRQIAWATSGRYVSSHDFAEA